MPFKTTGKLIIQVAEGTNDFIVIEDTVQVKFSGDPEGDIHWSSAHAADIKIRDPSGGNFDVPEGTLKNIFVLAGESNEPKKGTMTLKAEKLRKLKEEQRDDYDRILSAFEGGGTVFLKVTTTISKTYKLTINLSNAIPKVLSPGSPSPMSLPC